LLQEALPQVVVEKVEDYNSRALEQRKCNKGVYSIPIEEFEKAFKVLNDSKSELKPHLIELMRNVAIWIREALEEVQKETADDMDEAVTLEIKELYELNKSNEKNI